MTVTDHIFFWKMTVTYNKDVFSYGHLSDFLKSDFLSYTFFSSNLWCPCDKFIDYYRTNARAI